MSDMTASYGMLLDFIAFFRYFHTLMMSEVLYLHQTFTDCVPNQYAHYF